MQKTLRFYRPHIDIKTHKLSIIFFKKRWDVSLLKKIKKSIDHLYPEMVKIRRYLHQYPELSFKEFKTAAYIANFYEKLGIPFIKNVGGNGVIATLKGGKHGKTVAL